MNYARIKLCDIANGPGVRSVLFVSGCRHHCPECFNREAWDFDCGQPFTSENEDALIESLRPYYITGLTLLGGEPMEPENQKALLPFVARVRRELPGKTIWCYSGFTWEQLTGEVPSRAHCEETGALLSMIDVLVDGPFLADRKKLTLRFRGSDNQRIIDVRKTLAAGTVKLWIDQPIYTKGE